MTDPLRQKYCEEAPAPHPSKQHPQFPRSVCQAQWITSPSEHEEHPGRSLVTHNHQAILQWAAKRNAMPATIPGTRHDGHLGILRFDFPGWGGHERLEHVTWEQWLNTLDDRELVMVYQGHMENGHESNFFHFNSPYREHE
jgi:hypothetical protein